MLILIFLNLLVFLCAFNLTYKGLRFIDPVESFISLLILSFAQIIASELILGILGILTLGNLVVLNLTITTGVLFLLRKQQYSLNFTGLVDKFLDLFKSKNVLFIACVILSFVLVKLAINLVNPPFGWDDLNYHFTFPVEWIKHANLDNPITINDDPAPTYYPINGSLLYLWLIFPLKNVFIADIGQFPFFILSILSVYSLSKKLGLTREYAFYASGIFFLIPNFFRQLDIAYVDVMVAGLFLASFIFLYSKDSLLTLKKALMFSLSLGLLIGVKSVALPYSILLAIPFIYLCLRNSKSLGAYWLVFILIIVGLGGFIYIRNLMDTGNPLYPLDLRLFNCEIFKGVIDSQVWRAHFSSKDYSLIKDLFHEGLGAQTLVFILPAVILGLPIIWCSRRKELNPVLIYTLVLPLLIYLVYRFIIPLANLRYIYASLGFTMSKSLFNRDSL